MPNVRVSGLAFMFAACLIAGTSAQQTTTTAGATDGKKLKNPVASSPASIAAGQTAYQKYCRFCHGNDAKGNGPTAPKGTMPPDLTDAKWANGSTDGEIFLNIRDGIGPKFDMKAQKAKMAEPEIWNVVNYLRSLGPKK